MLIRRGFGKLTGRVQRWPGGLVPAVVHIASGPLNAAEAYGFQDQAWRCEDGVKSRRMRILDP